MWSTLFNILNKESNTGSLIKELETASIGYDCDRLRLLINQGVDVNTSLSNGEATPLFWAIEGRNAQMLSLLLCEGKANPNMARPSKPSISPLSYAITKKNYSLVALLLLSDAKYDSPNILSPDKKEKYCSEDSDFIYFYEKFVMLLDEKKKALKTVKGFNNLDIYKRIAKSYELFLNAYRHRFEEEHKEFLSALKIDSKLKTFQENTTIELFEARIKEFKELGKSSMNSVEGKKTDFFSREKPKSNKENINNSSFSPEGHATFIYQLYG